LAQQSFALVAWRQKPGLVSKLSGFVGKALFSAVFKQFGFPKTATLLHCAAPSRLKKWRKRDRRPHHHSGYETMR
jgi:hypothetical protein